MEYWFLIALIPPILFAINNVIDQFVARDYFADSVLAFLCLGGFINLAILPFFLFFWPEALGATLPQKLWLILSGIAYMTACYPYIKALQEDDASYAVPLFQTVPVFVLILGWIFLHEILTKEQLIASAIILIGSVGIVWDFSLKIAKKRLYLLMILSSFLFAVNLTLLRYGAVETSWLTTLFWLMTGWALFGVLLFIFSSKTRNIVLSTIKKTKGKVIAFSLIQESCDILASAMLTFAMSVAPAGAILMFVVNGLQPFALIVLSGILGLFFPRIFEAIKFDKTLLQKLFSTGIMIVGLYILLHAT
jgi:drug/metabolite transporter (DMT)-like permease